MSSERAAAAYPNALSFTRSLVRKMQREHWRITRLRLELDQEGRGEALYGITAPGRVFYFYAISNVFPPEEKVDRSFGINWDVSAAICQGHWSPEREAILRGEIPKQYDGRYDADVLCFCRGNRSERIFDEVVASLVNGAQPDTKLLAGVGYLLRSTAFAGNGLFGMKPFEGLGAAHPLGAPYHVQMLSAFMLREFVFDLVDWMALSQGGSAVPLDRRLKRYLGVGNSAGLGLIPFLANHPRIVHCWVHAQETAFAEASAREVSAKSPAAKQLLALIKRAATYFRQDPRDGNGIFASYERLAADFSLLADRLTAQLAKRKSSARPWSQVVFETTHDLHPETVEIVLGLLLELYPDVVERAEASLTATEDFDFRPHMTVSELRSLLHEDYGCAGLNKPQLPTETSFFWYYHVEAPYEPRRGRRGQGAIYEFESAMDLPLRISDLQAVLSQYADSMSVAELVACRPDLRAITTRVQSTAGLRYANLRESYIAESFTPFAACRLLLAFYGMEKFDPRPPRSTKGALLQGAPLADEIECGREGDWPFPLVPELESERQAATAIQAIPLRVLESPEVSAKAIQQVAAKVVRPKARPPSHIFPLELRKLLTKAFLWQGATLGVAEALARIVQIAATHGLYSLDAVLDCFAEWSIGTSPTLISSRQLEGGDAPRFASLPAAIDLACANATLTEPGICEILHGRPSPLLGSAAIIIASRGFLCLASDRETGDIWAAGPGPMGTWLLRADRHSAQASDMFNIAPGLGRLVVALGPASGEWAIACAEPVSRIPPAGSLGTNYRSDEAIALDVTRMNNLGLTIGAAAFDRLSALAKHALVPEQVECQLIRPQ